MNKIKETIQNVLNVLFEGRLEDVKAKYDDKMSNIIDNLSQGDPSGNNKYLDWMAKVYKDYPQTNEILKVVSSYHENLQRLTSQISTPIVDANKNLFHGRSESRVKNNPKDIAGFPSFESLKLIVTALEETKKERPDRDSIYQDDRWTVIVPKTHEAACKYGVHSNWCVSTSNSNYFRQYTKERDSLLFFILWRNKRDDNDKTEYKVAINARFRDWEDPKKWDWFDMPDHEMDPSLMLNVFPKNMIEKVQRYLVVEGKKQGKIIDTSKITKLIDDNAVYKFGESSGYIYFTTNSVQNFSKLPGYNYSFRHGRQSDSINEKNTVIYINKATGDFSTSTLNYDIWGEGRQRRDNDGNLYTEPRSLDAYQSWSSHYRNEKDFVQFVYGLDSSLTIPQELRDEIETKVKRELTELGGMWIQTRTTNLNVGDKVKWKKGRGYWQQRNSQWNESTIDRQTPSGFFVTGPTEEFPKGKRFKPSNSTSMDVWHSFSNNLDLSRGGQ